VTATPKDSTADFKDPVLTNESESAGQTAREATTDGKPTTSRPKRSRSAKLRAPFRRRRNTEGNETPSSEQSHEALADADSESTQVPESAHEEPVEALTYLEGSPKTAQRLGKYLQSEVLMPKLHKVLAQ